MQACFELKPEAHRPWNRDRPWVNLEDFFRCEVRVNESYSEARRLLNDRTVDVLMNIQSPH